jgi:hypothetical protein
MSDQIFLLVENVIQIAWDVLERSGYIADPRDASRFLVQNVSARAAKGERRVLLLVNRAIDDYRKHRRECSVIDITSRR